MLWSSHSRADQASKAQAFRRTHERWLTRAVAAATPAPRIPVRRVDDGGFDDLTATPRGREVAGRWWRMAFSKVRDAA